MQSLHAAISRIAVPAYSAEFEIVALFCALGLIIGLAVIPHLDAESVGWIFPRLE